jgi:hypothetical protein
MKNPTGNKLEKLVFGMFDQMVEGADKYVTKQESTWLIFTEDKRWVIEFTRDKTLWFNYNIFQSELELIGKDCTEERDLIKRWFESRFLNTPKVKETLDAQRISQITVERAIQDGVKHTHRRLQQFPDNAEDAIQNGVKDTIDEKSTLRYVVEDTIENGVKETTPSGYLGSIEMKGKIVHQIESPKQNNEVEDTIENGVKETTTTRWARKDAVENTIQNGVKHTEDGDWLDQDERIDDIIQNGVKETREVTFLNQMFIEETIQDGVKEIQPLPAQDGNRDWGLYYHRQEDRTKPHTEYVKEVIEDSYNHMGRVEGVIRNTDKDGI